MENDASIAIYIVIQGKPQVHVLHCPSLLVGGALTFAELSMT